MKETALASVDLTVRGAGIFGLSIAWTAVQRGARVQLIDPHGPAAGSSGGLVGALAPHVPENWNAKKAFQLDSLLMAPDFWESVQAVGGKDPGYRRSGRLQPILDNHGLTLAQRRADTAQLLWKDHAAWSLRKAVADPWEPETPTGWLIHDTLSGLIHPRKACDALVQALTGRGVTVQSEGEDIGATVWATGIAGLEELSTRHHRSMGNGVKGQAALLDFDARGQPQIFAGGVHIIPHQDGTVAIGSTSERSYMSGITVDTQLDLVIEAARQVMPALHDAVVIDRWAGVRPRARSRAPMLGAWPEREGHFIANGGFKIGFGMAPKVADVMVALLLEGRDDIPNGFRVEDNL